MRESLVPSVAILAVSAQRGKVQSRAMLLPMLPVRRRGQQRPGQCEPVKPVPEGADGHCYPSVGYGGRGGHGGRMGCELDPFGVGVGGCPAAARYLDEQRGLPCPVRQSLCIGCGATPRRGRGCGAPPAGVPARADGSGWQCSGGSAPGLDKQVLYEVLPSWPACLAPGTPLAQHKIGVAGRETQTWKGPAQRAASSGRPMGTRPTWVVGSGSRGKGAGAIPAPTPPPSMPVGLILSPEARVPSSSSSSPPARPPSTLTTGICNAEHRRVFASRIRGHGPPPRRPHGPDDSCATRQRKRLAGRRSCGSQRLAVCRASHPGLPLKRPPSSVPRSVGANRLGVDASWPLVAPPPQTRSTLDTQNSVLMPGAGYKRIFAQLSRCSQPACPGQVGEEAPELLVSAAAGIAQHTVHEVAQVHPDVRGMPADLRRLRSFPRKEAARRSRPAHSAVAQRQDRPVEPVATALSFGAMKPPPPHSVVACTLTLTTPSASRICSISTRHAAIRPPMLRPSGAAWASHKEPCGAVPLHTFSPAWVVKDGRCSTTAAGLAAASVGAPEHNTRLCFLTGAVDARGALDELLRFRNDGLTICATD
ncbi:hypothetical protein ACCO45_005186 [Purpureocillium lilacinum]|uniref:Uncharacterized protein n=1 Tax=Purpureocillium lilacinum TaxID=33203 RepID=A0ACC4DW15_PURLI